MTPERTIFSQMAALIKLRDDIQEYCRRQAPILLEQCLKEFFLEHPEVAGLKFDHLRGQAWIQMRDYGAEWLDAGMPELDLPNEKLSPQLAKCLRILEQHFDDLGEAVIALWGPETELHFRCIAGEVKRLREGLGPDHG